MKNKPGQLYGIGVGPGDPELIPVKSTRILKQVDMVFSAASTKNDYSISVDIAKPYIPKKTPLEVLHFPMTKDKEETEKAWKSHALTLIGHLKDGKDIAFLTLGDAMTYSTYGYILKYVRAFEPDIPIKTIPGITSYQAAAASLNMPLVEGEESLLIMSGVKGGDQLKKFSNQPENVVFLKAYRNVKGIYTNLEESGIAKESFGIINCGLPNEEIVKDIKELINRQPNYWTLVIAKKNKNHVPQKD